MGSGSAFEFLEPDIEDSDAVGTGNSQEGEQFGSVLAEVRIL